MSPSCGEIAHPYVQISNQYVIGSLTSLSASMIATGVASASMVATGLASGSMVAISKPSASMVATG